MELKDVLGGVLGVTLNLPDVEFASLFKEDGSIKEDALDTIKSKYAQQVQQAKDSGKKFSDAQYLKGKKDKGIEWEETLKKAGVEIGEAIGEDAVKKLVEHIETRVSAAAKPSELEDEKVKTHKLYRELEKRYQADLEAKDNEHKQKWSERDAKEQRERTLSDVKGKAKVILDELKPNLPEDPKKAANQLRFLYSDLDALQYEVDGEDYLIKDKDGNRLENEHGHPIKLNDLVKAKANEYFDFQASEKKGSPGDVTRGTKGGVKLQKPASQQDYIKQFNNIEESVKDPTERLKLQEELTTMWKS